MLDANIAGQLKTYMERLAAPIELVASLDDSARAEEMRVLLEQIVATSAQITLAAPGDEARKPSFAIRRAGESARMQFAGLPMGHEFTSLVLALLQASGYPPKIDAGVIEQIRALPGDYRFETYVSLSCQNCPDVVQALNTMAAINPKISNVMIDGAAFQDEVAQRQIMAVPALYLNGEPFAQGRISIEEILAKLDTGAAAREAAKLARKEPFDLLVVGGGPAASAAAVYAARKGIRTGVVAERFGGQVLDTMAIENFISVPHTEGPQLARALEQRAVAMRAVRHAAAAVLLLARHVHLAPARAGGQHHAAAPQLGAVFQRQRDVTARCGRRFQPRHTLAVHHVDFVRAHVGLQSGRELRAFGVRHGDEVVDAQRVQRLATKTFGDHASADALARGVDRCCRASGAAADDQHVEGRSGAQRRGFPLGGARVHTRQDLGQFHAARPEVLAVEEDGGHGHDLALFDLVLEQAAVDGHVAHARVENGHQVQRLHHVRAVVAGQGHVGLEHQVGVQRPNLRDHIRFHFGWVATGL